MTLPGDRILLGVSGGLDSMVLLDAMARLAPSLGVEFGVAHMEHGLRGAEGEEDLYFVVDQAGRRKMRTWVARADVRKISRERKLGVEEAARLARYALFTRVARKGKFTTVMTAHTADDNAETLLLNLMRGSGVRGLAAIPMARPLVEKIMLVRPLLEVDRASIEAYAQEQGITWREDSSNAEDVYARNRVRHELLPLLKQFNPGVVGTLNSTSAIMRELALYIDEAVEGALEHAAEIKPGESVQFQVRQLRHLQPAMRGEVLQQGVARAFDTQPLSYAAVGRALALLDSSTGSRAELMGGISAVRDRDLVIVRPDRAPEPRQPERYLQPGEKISFNGQTIETTVIERSELRFSRDPMTEFIDLDKLASPRLTLRPWREGDRFNPFGMEGEKKVSDYLVDAKVPRDRKGRIAVLADGDTVVWLCGLRLDDRYRVDSSTQRILQLVLRPNNEGRRGG